MCPAEKKADENANGVAGGPGRYFCPSLLPVRAAALQGNVAWTDPDSLCLSVRREPATGRGRGQGRFP